MNVDVATQFVSRGNLSPFLEIVELHKLFQFLMEDEYDASEHSWHSRPFPAIDSSKNCSSLYSG